MSLRELERKAEIAQLLLHGRRIDVRSKPGNGATFVVELPRA
jgi:signal transduction histidine kinase